MNRKVKYFGLTWLIYFILFNVITFVVTAEALGVERLQDALFWVGYAFIVLSLVIQLVVSYVFCHQDTNEKLFYHIPLLKVSYGFVTAEVIVGIVFLCIPSIPAWIGAIVCMLVAVVFAILANNAKTAADTVVAVGEKVKKETAYMKNAVVDAETLVARSETEEIKVEVTKVYEAFRYTDYVSHEQLTSIEQEISNNMTKLKEAVKSSDLDSVKAFSKEICLLVKERENKQKTLK